MLVHIFGVPHLFLVMFDLALDKTEQDLDHIILLQAIINRNITLRILEINLLRLCSL